MRRVAPASLVAALLLLVPASCNAHVPLPVPQIRGVPQGAGPVPPTLLAVDVITTPVAGSANATRVDYTRLSAAAAAATPIDVTGGSTVQAWVAYLESVSNLTSFTIAGADLVLWPEGHPSRPRPCTIPTALPPPAAPARAPLACVEAMVPNGSGDGTQYDLFPLNIGSFSRKYGFACLVQSTTHRLLCWGNTSVQVPTDRGTASPPPGLPPVKQVSVGSYFSCAVGLYGGTLHCWGCLNSPSMAGKCTPPSPLPPIAMVAVGYRHACAVAVGTGNLTCWGDSVSGAKPPPGLGPVSSVVAGDDVTCAVLSGVQVGNSTVDVSVAGRVVCWGNVARAGGPLPPDLAPAASVALGDKAMCALAAADGAVTCVSSISGCMAGDDACGVLVPPGLPPAAALSVSDYSACIIARDGGRATCWNLPQVTGRVFSDIRPGPSIPPLLAVEASGLYPCGISALTRELVCWGWSASALQGQEYVQPPLLAGVPLLRMMQGKTRSACAVEAQAGEVRCWSTAPPQLLPVDMPPYPPFSLPWTADAIPLFTKTATLLVTPEGVLQPLQLRPGWVPDTPGGSGFGNATIRPNPDGPAIADLLVRLATACAIYRRDRSLVCDTATVTLDLSPLSKVGPIAGVAIGDAHACVLHASTGNVTCVGENSAGQLDIPPDLPPAAAIDASNTCTCALAAGTGKVTCWGTGPANQTLPPRDLPPASGISVGAFHACAIAAGTGNLTCWGRPFWGDETGVDKQVPPNLPPVVAVLTGTSLTCVLTTDLLPRCWAADSDGYIDSSVLPWQGPGRKLAGHRTAGEPWRLTVCTQEPAGPPACDATPGVVRYAAPRLAPGTLSLPLRPSLSPAVMSRSEWVGAGVGGDGNASLSTNATVSLTLHGEGLGAAPAPGAPGAVAIAVRLCSWAPQPSAAGRRDSADGHPCDSPEAVVWPCTDVRVINSTTVACNISVAALASGQPAVRVTVAGYDLGWQAMTNPNQPSLTAVLPPPGYKTEVNQARVWWGGREVGPPSLLPLYMSGVTLTLQGKGLWQLDMAAEAGSGGGGGQALQNPSCVYFPALGAATSQPSAGCTCNDGKEDFPGEGEVPVEPAYIQAWADDVIQVTLPPGLTGIRYAAVCAWGALAELRSQPFALNLPLLLEVVTSGLKLGQQSVGVTVLSSGLRNSAPPGPSRPYLSTPVTARGWYPSPLPWDAVQQGAGWPMARLLATIGPRCFTSQGTAEALQPQLNSTGGSAGRGSACQDWGGWTAAYDSSSSGLRRGLGGEERVRTALPLNHAVGAGPGATLPRLGMLLSTVATFTMDSVLPAGLLQANLSLVLIDATGALLRPPPPSGDGSAQVDMLPLPIPQARVTQVSVPALTDTGATCVLISGSYLRSDDDLREAIETGWWQEEQQEQLQQQQQARVVQVGAAGPEPPEPSRTAALKVIFVPAMSKPASNSNSSNSSSSSSALLDDFPTGSLECEDATTVEDASGSDAVMCTLPASATVGSYWPRVMVASGGTGRLDPTQLLPIDASAVPALFLGCAQGYFAAAGEACQPCSGLAFPGGAASCPGGENYPIPSSGWYSLNSTEERYSCPTGRLAGSRNVCLVPCEPPSACLGDNVCGEGYTNAAPGWRCSACAAGHYRSLSGTCEVCETPQVAFLIAMACLVPVLAAAYFVIRKAGLDLSILSLLIDFWQMTSLAQTSPAGTGGVALPKQLHPLLTVASAISMDVAVLHPECFNALPSSTPMFVLRFYVATLLPPAVLLLLLLPALPALWRVCTGRSTARGTWGKWQELRRFTVLLRGYLRLLQVLYLIILSTVAGVWNCVPSNPPSPDGALYLAAIPYERCDSPDPNSLQNRLQALAIPAAVVYVAGLPLALAYLLHAYGPWITADQAARAAGEEEAPDAASDKLRRTIGPLYGAYRPGMHWFSLATIMRKALVCGLILAFNKAPTLQLIGGVMGLVLALVVNSLASPLLSPVWTQALVAKYASSGGAGAAPAPTQRFDRHSSSSGSSGDGTVAKGQGKEGRYGQGAGAGSFLGRWAVTLLDRNNLQAALLGCAALVLALAAVWYGVAPGTSAASYYPNAALLVVVGISGTTCLALILSLIALLLDLRLQVAAKPAILRTLGAWCPCCGWCCGARSGLRRLQAETVGYPDLAPAAVLDPRLADVEYELARRDGGQGHGVVQGRNVLLVGGAGAGSLSSASSSTVADVGRSPVNGSPPQEAPGLGLGGGGAGRFTGFDPADKPIGSAGGAMVYSPLAVGSSHGAGVLKGGLDRSTSKASSSGSSHVAGAAAAYVHNPFAGAAAAGAEEVAGGGAGGTASRGKGTALAAAGAGAAWAEPTGREARVRGIQATIQATGRTMQQQ